MYNEKMICFSVIILNMQLFILMTWQPILVIILMIHSSVNPATAKAGAAPLSRLRRRCLRVLYNKILGEKLIEKKWYNVRNILISKTTKIYNDNNYKAHTLFRVSGGPQQGMTFFSDLRSFQVSSIEGERYFFAVRLSNRNIVDIQLLILIYWKLILINKLPIKNIPKN